MAYSWDEHEEDKTDRKRKDRKPRNTAFLNEDGPASKFFKRKKKRVVKKNKGSL